MRPTIEVHVHPTTGVETTTYADNLSPHQMIKDGKTVSYTDVNGNPCDADGIALPTNPAEAK